MKSLPNLTHSGLLLVCLLFFLTARSGDIKYDNCSFLIKDNYGHWYIGELEKRFEYLLNNNLDKNIYFNMETDHRSAVVSPGVLLEKIGIKKDLVPTFNINRLKEIVMPVQLSEFLIELASLGDYREIDKTNHQHQLGDLGKVEVLSYFVLLAYNNPGTEVKFDASIDEHGSYHIYGNPKFRNNPSYWQILEFDGNAKVGQISQVSFFYNKKTKAFIIGKVK